MRNSKAAFTLLEVLAAVALLGLLYTLLARVAAEGLYGEGQSRRRMEASFLADRELRTLESELDQGAVPPTGSQEQEEGIFLITREVMPFEPPLEWTVDRNGTSGTNRDRRSTPRNVESSSTLFPDTNSRKEPAVREITIRVVWTQGESENEVIRTTYGFDSDAASNEIAMVDGRTATE
ncbi:prepilin-type N-terminal cleavage/methylation domain-containing protein [Myxococcota bacterium]|nr:prepilin-type N-terminal cleavage/methylation domain-containing protein [Myxococcota bacterium]